MFFIIAFTIWALLNSYFLWRILTLPIFSSKVAKYSTIFVVVFLALSYIVGKVLVHKGIGGFFSFLEVVGSVWIGILFIFITYLFFADILTLFGAFKCASVYARYLALIISFFLVIFSFYQGMRTPVIREKIIETNGKTGSKFKIAQISDLHLGNIKGEGFLKKVVEKVNEQNPDIVVITGDIIDSDGKKEKEFQPIFRKIKAKNGVYGVLGNHEYYHGAHKNLKFFEESGIAILRNENKEVIDGVIIAGVDDLSAKREFNQKEDFLENALKGRKSGYTILLSHSPLEVEKASRMGVNLMLSGHCHNGQIWPFKFFSKMFYPYNYGRYKIKDMDLIVTSGTGTWGPPMRLFKPNEIVVIELN